MCKHSILLERNGIVVVDGGGEVPCTVSPECFVYYFHFIISRECQMPRERERKKEKNGASLHIQYELFKWIFVIFVDKHSRYADLCGLCFFAGLVVGAVIRYAATKTPVTHLNVEPAKAEPSYNQSLPPDTLWLKVILYIKFVKLFHLRCKRMPLISVGSIPRNVLCDLMSNSICVYFHLDLYVPICGI